MTEQNKEVRQDIKGLSSQLQRYTGGLAILMVLASLAIAIIPKLL